MIRLENIGKQNGKNIVTRGIDIQDDALDLWICHVQLPLSFSPRYRAAGS